MEKVEMMENKTEIFEEIASILKEDYIGSEKLPNKGATEAFRAFLATMESDHLLNDMTFHDILQLYLSVMMGHRVHFYMEDQGDDFYNFSRGFSVRGREGRLYVTRVTADRRLQPGDEILTLDGSSPEDYMNINFLTEERRAYEDSLDWTALLSHASYITVKRGENELGEMELYEYEPEKFQPVLSAEMQDENTVLFRMNYIPEAEEMFEFLQKNKALWKQASTLLLDLRENIGGPLEGLSYLIPFVCTSTVTSAAFFGTTPHMTRYSERNIDSIVGRLQKFLTDEDDYTRSIAEMSIRNLQELENAGDIEEYPEEDDDGVPYFPMASIGKVYILTDCGCQNEAEAFVQAARKAGKARIIGRMTSGDFRYKNLLTKEFSEGTLLEYPVSLEKNAYLQDGAPGLMPDIYIPWTKEECVKDVILEKTLNFG